VPPVTEALPPDPQIALHNKFLAMHLFVSSKSLKDHEKKEEVPYVFVDALHGKKSRSKNDC